MKEKKRPIEIVITLDFESGKEKSIQTKFKDGEVIKCERVPKVTVEGAKLLTTIEYWENERICSGGTKPCCRWITIGGVTYCVLYCP